MIQIFYNGKKYEFSNDIWDKYCEMHPIRTREALLSTLKICYPQGNPSITEIEKLISQEYDLYSNMDFITQKARKKYDKSF